MTFMLYLIDKAFEAYVWYTCLDVIGLFVLYIHMVFDACIYIYKYTKNLVLQNKDFIKTYIAKTLNKIGKLLIYISLHT